MSIKDDYFKWYRENYQKLKPTEKAEADKEVSNWKWHDKLEEIILNDPKYDKEKWKYALDHMYWRDAWLALAEDDEIVAADREVYEYLTELQGKGENFKVEYRNDVAEKYKGEVSLRASLAYVGNRKCIKILRTMDTPYGSVIISTSWLSLMDYTISFADGVDERTQHICDLGTGKLSYEEEWEKRRRDFYADDIEE